LRRLTTASAQVLRLSERFFLFSTEITIYLRNSTRWAHGYYGTL